MRDRWAGQNDLNKKSHKEPSKSTIKQNIEIGKNGTAASHNGKVDPPLIKQRNDEKITFQDLSPEVKRLLEKYIESVIPFIIFPDIHEELLKMRNGMCSPVPSESYFIKPHSGTSSSNRIPTDDSKFQTRMKRECGLTQMGKFEGKSYFDKETGMMRTPINSFFRQYHSVQFTCDKTLLDKTNVERNHVYMNIQGIYGQGRFNRDTGMMTYQLHAFEIVMDCKSENGQIVPYEGGMVTMKKYKKCKLHTSLFMVTDVDFTNAAPIPADRLLYATLHPDDCRLFLRIPVLHDSYLGKKVQTTNMIEETNNVMMDIQLKLHALNPTKNGFSFRSTLFTRHFSGGK